VSGDSTKQSQLRFHYLSLLEAEYKSLIDEATKLARADGRQLLAEAHDYNELTDLQRIKQLLDQPNTVVEMPLHTAAQLLRQPGGASYRAIASPYTFTSNAAKIALYHYGDTPAMMSQLVCAAEDSIATQLVRYYALRKNWPFKEFHSGFLIEKGSYKKVFECAEGDAKQLAETGFLVSGTRVIEDMDRLRERQEGPSKERLHKLDDDIYAAAKDSWSKLLGQVQSEQPGELPDLPGTIIVVRAHETEAAHPFFQPLIAAIARWNPDGKEAAAMGSPHIGTPTSVVALVVYMELMARESARHGLTPPPVLDYADFFLSDVETHWRDHKQQTVRAVELGAKWLFKTRIDVRSDFDAYFRRRGERDTLSRALSDLDQEYLDPLWQRLEELKESANQQSDPALLRSKTKEVFLKLVTAKSKFSEIERRLPRPKYEIPEDAYFLFSLEASNRAAVNLRVRRDSWSPAYLTEKILPIIKSPLRLPRCLYIASLICQRGRVSNDELKALLEHAPSQLLPLPPFRGIIFDVRALFRFVRSHDDHQVIGDDLAQRVLHPSDVELLKSMRSV
jgi:hypothetical protein